MPVTERLRALNSPEPTIDLDGHLAQIRRRASSKRRQQLVAFAAAAVVVIVALIVGAGALVGDDSAQVDTINAPQGDTWLLPQPAPDGYQLGWVDIPPPPDDLDAPLWERAHDYAYGYQTPSAASVGPLEGAHELDVRVHVGETLEDPDVVAEGWGDGGIVDSLNGRPAIRWTDGRYTSRMLLEVDGGVVHVLVHPWSGASTPDGEDTAMPAPEVVDRFAASIRPVSRSEWNDVLESTGADDASQFEPEVQRQVIKGNGWSLLHDSFRAPASVTQQRLGVAFDGQDETIMSAAQLGRGVAAEAVPPLLVENNRVRVVWGEVPAEASRVTVTVGEDTFEAQTVQVAGGAVFAVDVSGTEADEGSVQVFDASGTALVELPIYRMPE